MLGAATECAGEKASMRMARNVAAGTARGRPSRPRPQRACGTRRRLRHAYPSRRATGDETFAEFVELYLVSHAANVDPRTIRTLRERLGVVAPKQNSDDMGEEERRTQKRSYRTAIETFGDVRLRDLERAAAKIAAWEAKLPPAYRPKLMGALSQVLESAVAWDYIVKNPVRSVRGERAVPALSVVRRSFRSRAQRSIGLQRNSDTNPLRRGSVSTASQSSSLPNWAPPGGVARAGAAGPRRPGTRGYGRTRLFRRAP